MGPLEWIKANRLLAEGLFLVFLALSLWGAYATWHHKVYQEGFDAGYAKADATWTTKYNEKVEEFNKRVKELEDMSRSQGEQLKGMDKKVAGAIQVALDDYRKKHPPIVLHDSTGNVVTQPANCPKIDHIYMGQEFTDQWNLLIDKAWEGVPQ